MSFLDRFRKPQKYFLQVRKGKNFETLFEYDPKDYPIPPSESTVSGEMEDEDLYHRLIAVYPSGNNKIIWEHPGKRKAGRPKGEGKFDIKDLPKLVEEALEPLDAIAETVDKINETFSKFRGESDGLTRDDVKQVVQETVGSSGMGSFTMPPPPSWIWFVHPYTRGAIKDIMEDVEDTFVKVGERIVKAAMTPDTTAETPSTAMPSLSDMIDREMTQPPPTERLASKPKAEPKEKEDEDDEP